MNIYAVPMLISGILCSLLFVVTWTYRRRESINRVFSFFTMALALDAFAFFAMYQYGNVEYFDAWVKITFTAGFLVPTGLVLFFYAFTGYNKKLDEKVLGIKTGYFRIGAFSSIFVIAIISQFTNLILDIPENPRDFWDVEFGVAGNLMFPIFGFMFIYLFTMAFKSYKTTEDKPQKHFILLLTLGTFTWLLAGYTGALILPVASQIWQSISYLGTASMAMFYFIAILNYQSDKVHELNINLERKVEKRTRHLEETRAQLIQSEKMATLGHLVAGVAHEMNTPAGAVYSTHDTLSVAAEKLKQALEKNHGINLDETKDVSKVLNAIDGVSDVIKDSGERINGVVKRLKFFAQLDEADLQRVDFNECIENTIEMFQFHLKPGISIRKELAELPKVTCYPAKVNQVCFQLLQNANMAIKDSGEIVIHTGIQNGELSLSVSDNGRGVPHEELEKIFDPGYTGWNLKVGAGLGLAICYQVAQDHNGKMDVDSEPGKGSKFIFSFPVDNLA